jgi:hypothetical protein
MSDEQINIAIAEHCGWTVSIPDYCNDLNAMREAEETLTGLLLDKYVDNCMAEVEYWPSHLLYLSARRRAEAFLQTIGKWEANKTLMSLPTPPAPPPPLTDGTVLIKEGERP